MFPSILGHLCFTLVLSHHLSTLVNPIVTTFHFHLSSDKCTPSHPCSKSSSGFHLVSTTHLHVMPHGHCCQSIRSIFSPSCHMKNVGKKQVNVVWRMYYFYPLPKAKIWCGRGRWMEYGEKVHGMEEMNGGTSTPSCSYITIFPVSHFIYTTINFILLRITLPYHFVLIYKATCLIRWQLIQHK